MQSDLVKEMVLSPNDILPFEAQSRHHLFDLISIGFRGCGFDKMPQMTKRAPLLCKDIISQSRMELICGGGA